MAKLTTEQTMLRAKSHEKKGEVDQARLLYKTILDTFPNNKRAQQALASLNQPKPVVSNKGTNPPQNQLEALFSLYNKGQLSAALEKAQLLVVGYPSSSIVWNILGATNSDLKKLTEAELCLKKAIELSPNDAGSHYGMGIILHEQGKFDDAIEAYRRALNIKPDYADAHSRMGITLRDQGKLEAAIEVYQLALSILPNSAEIHNGMGIALAKQSKIDAAIEAYQRALKIKSDYAEAHNNMGIAIKDQGKFEDAIAAYQRALKIKPNYDKAHYNMGIALKEQGKLDEAMEAYKCALKIKPDYADALFGLALILNLKGDLINGFELYEWRISDKELKIRKPRAHLSWDGTQNISGKRFVIYEEQGLGDKIQFCRYLPLLVQQNALVTFQVTSSLHSLLRTLDNNIILTNDLPREDQIDFEVPLMSLPHLFNTDFHTIPALSPYLYADKTKVKAWAEKLCEGKFRIGICWQGAKSKVDVGRSFPLSLFEQISRVSDIELISLHQGIGEDQIFDANFNLISFGNELDHGTDAFIDTAAIMMNCDLIITSDTAVAHLAGALGRPTWLALKYIPEWRWMLSGSKSPWYPTMTLYRQQSAGNWADVFEAIERDLRLLLDGKG